MLRLERDAKFLTRAHEIALEEIRRTAPRGWEFLEVPLCWYRAFSKALDLAGYEIVPKQEKSKETK